jgi:hypothetical protein
MIDAGAEEIISFGSFRLFPGRRVLEQSGQPVRATGRSICSSP